MGNPITDDRHAVAAQVRDVLAAASVTWQVPDDPPANITPPAAVVTTAEGTWEQVRFGVWALPFAVRFYVDPLHLPDLDEALALVVPSLGGAEVRAPAAARYGAVTYMAAAIVIPRHIALTAPPAPPTGLIATPGPGNVALQWDAYPDPACTFDAYRDGVKANDRPLTVETFPDVGLDPGTYAYHVTATSPAGVTSAPSATASATVT